MAGIPGDSLALTVNAGSSSLRIGLFALDADAEPVGVLRLRAEPLGGDRAPTWELQADVPGVATPAQIAPAGDHRAALASVTAWLAAHDWLERVVVVGHRIVHGGERAGPTAIDASLRAELAQWVALAPLHQPHALAAIDHAGALLPGCLQVACFDTAFHRTLPMIARRYALPRLPDGTTVLRHGFHGLSCESVNETLRGLAPQLRRVVIAHLGAGASLTAVADGVSVDTTMGLTPLDGVPMATRSGALDPGILLWLMQAQGYDGAALEDLLYRRSGLLGLSGISGDMRILLAAAEPEARLAVEIFAQRCAKAIASLAVTLEGLDAVAFTGGIGEHAAEVRRLIAGHCRWLGLDLDPDANAAHLRCISQPTARVSAWVIPSDEERVIARQAFACHAAVQG
jgi:acetate kinase